MVVLEGQPRIGLRRDIWRGGSALVVAVPTSTQPRSLTPEIIKADAQQAAARLDQIAAADARLADIMSRGKIVHQYLYDYGAGFLGLALLDETGNVKHMLLQLSGDFGPEWVGAVRTLCDPVLDAANVGFIAQVQGGETGPALLWEASPEQFAARYPESDTVNSYGSSWPPPCIDYWVYVDAEQRRARFSIEGWNERDPEIDLSGDGHRDGLAIAREFVRILRVPGPHDDA